jgi:hypothetical protein
MASARADDPRRAGALHLSLSARCGSSGSAGFAHASIRAFAAAHAPPRQPTPRPAPLFGATAPLGAQTAPVAAALRSESSLFVFGGDRTEKSPQTDGDNSGQVSHHKQHTTADENAQPVSKEFPQRPSAFAKAAADGSLCSAFPDKPAATCLAQAQPASTVFGPSAPQMAATYMCGNGTPKRPREPPAVDDLANLLAQLSPSFARTADGQSTGDDGEVDATAQLLANCGLPGKRPRTQPQAEDPLLTQAFSLATDENSAEREARGIDVAADDDELSFLVTRCDLDAVPSERVGFMPYIA